jgi:hypothetical protein
MDSPGTIFRVTVRGQFRDLTDQARTFLADHRAEHDIFLAAYTEEGTFTYDERIAFFNFRYEVRGVPTEGDAAERGIAEAKMFLDVMGIGHGPLKSTVVDMLAMMRDQS